jgi:hypothetical protein
MYYFKILYPGLKYYIEKIILREAFDGNYRVHHEAP